MLLSTQQAILTIRQMGGIIRTAEAMRNGVHPRTLYTLRDEGLLEQLSRGIYRLAELEPPSNPDLITVTARFPKAVVCLISALDFHHITTQIPHEISIAIKRGTRVPTLDYPPIDVHQFSATSFDTGIETHTIDEVPIQIYAVEKTLVDCFKFRNKIGMDVTVEALQLYKARNKFKLDEIIKYAHLCRVESIMKPYLEALL